MLEHLRGLRTEWEDKIPDKVIHSDTTPPRNFKVRRSWFTGVVADVECLLIEETITGDAKRAAAEQLLERFTSEGFQRQELTIPDDIQTANRLIDIILGREISTPRMEG